MKDGKLKKILFVVVIVLLLVSISYSAYRNRQKNPYRHVKMNITFDEDYSYPEEEYTSSAKTEVQEVESSVEEIETSVMESESQVVSSRIESFQGNGVVEEQNLGSVIIDIARLDDMNNLVNYPVTSNVYNQLYDSDGLSGTISSSSEIEIQKIGITDNNEFMCMFLTQTSSYYVRGNLVNGQIDSKIGRAHV